MAHESVHHRTHFVIVARRSPEHSDERVAPRRALDAAPHALCPVEIGRNRNRFLHEPRLVTRFGDDFVGLFVPLIGKEHRRQQAFESAII